MAGRAPRDEVLEVALNNVYQQSVEMKRALDRSDIRTALKRASSMVSELRSPDLSPTSYYNLYITVTDQLRELAQYFEYEDDREQKGEGGRSIVDLYENVQHAGNIIPRLYLLITVGGVYITSNRAPAKDVLFDMVELCRGVQHPMRGLFLRDYLAMVAKENLPDKVGDGSEQDGKDGIEFILQNFGEMNKLWVRMQHQGSMRDRKKREEERRRLRQLVGLNLDRLSEMKAMDIETYEEYVLPRILEKVVNCRDQIAQEYLMDIIVNAFPDDYHLATLELFLTNCLQLEKGVNVKDIIGRLIERLISYAESDDGYVDGDVDYFGTLQRFILLAGRKTKPPMPLNDVLELLMRAAQFSEAVYTDSFSNIEKILNSAADACAAEVGATEDNPSGSTLIADPQALRRLNSLFEMALAEDPLRGAMLPAYGRLVSMLQHRDQRRVSVFTLERLVAAGVRLDSVEKINSLYTTVGVLIRDQLNYVAADIKTNEQYEYKGEQRAVVRSFQLVAHDNVDVWYGLLVACKKHFKEGSAARMVFTYPAVVSSALRLARVLKATLGALPEDAEDKPRLTLQRVFSFVHKTITALPEDASEASFRMFYDAAKVADDCKEEDITYEFITRCVLVYEEQIADAKQRFSSITYLAGGLCTFENLNEDNYGALVSKVSVHCHRLLKMEDRVRAVSKCAHLFWTGDPEKPRYAEQKRVISCLSRSLKIAAQCMSERVNLFVEILAKYIYFYRYNCPSVTAKHLQALVQLIEFPEEDDDEPSQQAAKKHYRNILLWIQDVAKEEPVSRVGQLAKHLKVEDLLLAAQ